MKTIEPPIIVQQSFDATPAQLWSALTELDQMHKWYFSNIPDFQPTVGFKTEFLITNEGRSFTHQWEVTEAISNQRIAYNWTFKEYSGLSVSIFEIIPEGATTIVKLTAKVLEPHPQDIPEFKRESGVGGWNYFIKERLKNYMDALE